MTCILKPHVHLDSDETALSYLSRLAALHTGRPMEALLQDLGVRIESFVSGYPEEVTRVAECVGIAPAALRRGVFRLSRPHKVFRNQPISRYFVNPWAVRVCGHCLEEDGDERDWKHRTIWCFSVVHRCPVHNVPLVSVGEYKTTDLRVADRKKIGSAIETRREPSSVPRYLQELASALDKPDLDGSFAEGQTLEQVFSVSEVIGAVLNHGHQVRVRSLPSHELERATEVGFQYCRRGSDGLQDAVETIYDRRSTTTPSARGTALYGRLYSWIDSRRTGMDMGPVHSVLYKHAIRHIPAGPSDRVLGVAPVRRRIHSVASFGKVAEISREAVVEVLTAIGHIPKGAPRDAVSRMIFRAADLEPLTVPDLSRVLEDELHQIIGTSKAVADELVRAGMFRTIPSKYELPRGPASWNSTSIVKVLLARISRVPINDNPAIGVRLILAGKDDPSAVPDLLRRILSGELDAVRASGPPAIDRIRVIGQP